MPCITASHSPTRNTPPILRRWDEPETGTEVKLWPAGAPEQSGELASFFVRRLRASTTRQHSSRDFVQSSARASSCGRPTEEVGTLTAALRDRALRAVVIVVLTLG